jgi:Fur family ferric uptake transcriptional regulator
MKLANRRNTPQRKAILSELRCLKTHPTASELYEAVRRKVPRISLGTVYRNLEVLSQQGLIRKLDFAGNEARFDGNIHDHLHVRCMDCGRIADVDGNLNLAMCEPVEFLNGYRILGHRLDFIGLCPDCQ